MSAYVFAGEEDEFPWLLVDCRGSQTRAFFDIIHFFCRNGVRLIGTHGITCLADFFKVHKLDILESVNKCTQKIIKLYFMRLKIHISSQNIILGKYEVKSLFL